MYPQVKSQGEKKKKTLSGYKIQVYFILNQTKGI